MSNSSEVNSPVYYHPEEKVLREKIPRNYVFVFTFNQQLVSDVKPSRYWPWDNLKLYQDTSQLHRVERKCVNWTFKLIRKLNYHGLRKEPAVVLSYEIFKLAEQRCNSAKNQAPENCSPQVKAAILAFFFWSIELRKKNPLPVLLKPAHVSPAVISIAFR